MLSRPARRNASRNSELGSLNSELRTTNYELAVDYAPVEQVVRKYWLVALVLLVGGGLALALGFAAGSWGAAGLLGGATGIAVGAIIAAIQGRQPSKPFPDDESR